MDVKEKLMEIVKKAAYSSLPSNTEDSHLNMFVMNLLAHGVTVQDLDGCEYCNEDGDGYRKMIGAFSITNPFHGNVWNIETRHCKPRQIYFCPMCGRRLPQPPKGE